MSKVLSVIFCLECQAGASHNSFWASHPGLPPSTAAPDGNDGARGRPLVTSSVSPASS